jgi:hypothetical protein
MAKNLSRRSILIGTGGLIVTAAGGLLGWNSLDTAPIAAVPAGWYLISRYGPGDRERQLIVWHSYSLEQRVLEVEVGTNFLNAVLSPDRHQLAVLKRVTRGSMPTDAIALYNSQTFERTAMVEVQIAFQRSPTFTIGWSADAQHIAVSYDMSGRTLLFRVRSSREIVLKAMLDHASFQYHPILPDTALYVAASSSQIRIVQFMHDNQERVLEHFSGTNARWNIDGSRVSYQEELGARGGQRLVVRNLATGVTRALPVQVKAKTWSPDGQHLAVYCLASNDQFHLGKLLPANFIPGWRPGALEPRLLVYDSTSGSVRTITHLRPGFQLAHLQWLHPDWLLVGDVQAKQSFLTDRRGEQRTLITMMDNFTPLLRWLPQV